MKPGIPSLRLRTSLIYTTLRYLRARVGFLCFHLPAKIHVASWLATYLPTCFSPLLTHRLLPILTQTLLQRLDFIRQAP